MVGGTARRVGFAPIGAAALVAAAWGAGVEEKALFPDRPEIFEWSVPVGFPPAANRVFVPHASLPAGFRFRPISAEAERGGRVRLRFEITATGAVPPGEYRGRIRYASLLDTSPYNPRTSVWVVDREILLAVAPRRAMPPDRSPYGLALAAYLEDRPDDALEILSRAPEGPAVDRLRRVIALEPFRELWTPEELARRSRVERAPDGRRIWIVSDRTGFEIVPLIAKIDRAATEGIGIRVPPEITVRIFLLADRGLFDAFARLLGAEEPQTIQGLYNRTFKIIAIRVDFDRSILALSPSTTRFLFQEYTRFVLDAALGSAPAWIEDAMALRIAGQALRERGESTGPVPADVARVVRRERYRVAAGWLPKLLEMDRSDFDRDRASNAALAWHFLAFAEAEAGSSTIRRYLRALQEGASWREAAKILFTPAFEARWLEALRRFDR